MNMSWTTKDMGKGAAWGALFGLWSGLWLPYQMLVSARFVTLAVPEAEASEPGA